MGAQTELHAQARGRVMAMDSAYDVAPQNRDRDIVINASYCGVLPARFIAEQRPRGAIGVDCGVGPAGASVAGLWYLEALNIPAAAGMFRASRYHRPATDAPAGPTPQSTPMAPRGRCSAMKRAGNTPQYDALMTMSRSRFCGATS